MRLHASITNAIMTILFVLCLGSLGFSQSYWKRTYPGLSNAMYLELSQIPTNDGNFFILGDSGSGIWVAKIKPNGDTLWSKTFGGPNDIPQSIIPSNDGNFLILGSTVSFGAGNYDIWVIKMKPNGDTLWSKTFGGPINEYPQSIIPSNDGNFLILGSTESFGAVNTDIWVIKMKPNGDTLWSNIFSKQGGAPPQSIIPTTDDNFLILGYTYSFDAGNYDIWVIKMKPNGDTLWSKTFGGPMEDHPQSIIPTNDGNFLILGYTISFGAGNEDIWVIKMKPNGDTLWSKTFGGPDFDSPKSIIPTTDGNFLILGYTYSFGAGNGDIWVIKMKPNGDTLWSKTLGRPNSDSPLSINPANDGNFLILGSTVSFGAGNYDIWVIKMKPNGDTLWSKTFGGPGYEYPQSIISTNDGNLLLTGTQDRSLMLISIISDQYTYKDSPFTYKIPVYDVDSNNFAYIPLKTPTGMTVSPGGTISWTPTSSTVYMDHVEYLVMNDAGKKDTLTFNVFVNSSYHASTPVKSIHKTMSNTKQFDIISNTLGKQVKFSLPALTSSLLIFDITGKIIDKITPEKSSVNNLFVWPTNSIASKNRIPTGKYFAKATTGKSSVVKSFLWVQ